MSGSPPTFASLKVGMRVSCGEGKEGTIRFLGKTQFASGEWVGVELTKNVGKNNGVVQGKKYFDCKAKFGLFVKPTQLTILSKTRSSAAAGRASALASADTKSGSSLSKEERKAAALARNKARLEQRKKLEAAKKKKAAETTTALKSGDKQKSSRLRAPGTISGTTGIKKPVSKKTMSSSSSSKSPTGIRKPSSSPVKRQTKAIPSPSTSSTTRETEKELAKAKAAERIAQNAVVELKAELAALKSNAASAASEAASALEALQVRADEAEASLKQVRESKKQDGDALASLKNELDEFRMKAELSEKKYDEEKVELQRQIEELKSSQRLATQGNDEAKRAQEKTVATIQKKSDEEKNELRRELEKVREELKVLTSAIADAEAVASRARSACQKAEEEREAAVQTNTTLQTKMEENALHLLKMKEKAENVEKLLQESREREAKKAKEKGGEAAALSAELEATRVSASAVQQKLENEVSSLHSELNAIKNDAEAAKRDFKHQFEVLKREHEDEMSKNIAIAVAKERKNCKEVEQAHLNAMKKMEMDSESKCEIMEKKHIAALQTLEKEHSAALRVAVEARHEAIEKEKAKHREVLKKQKELHEAAIKAEKDLHVSTIEQHNSALKKAKTTQQAAMIKAKKAHDAAMAAKEEAHAAAISAYKNKLEEGNSAMLNASAKEVEELKELLASKEEDLRIAEEGRKEEETARVAAEEERSAAEEELAAAEKRATTAEADLGVIRGERNTFEKRYKELAEQQEKRLAEAAKVQAAGAKAERYRKENEEKIKKLEEMVELLTLEKEECAVEKEVAEEEAAENALRVEELETELSVAKDSIESAVTAALAKAGAISSSSNEIDVSALTTQNLKLREALGKLHTQTTAKKAEDARVIRELERKAASAIENAEKVTKLEEKKVQMEEEMAELRDMVDDAGAFEEMIEDLSEKNLELSDRKAELEQALHEMEEMAEIAEETEEMQRDLEKELRGKLSTLTEQLRQVAEAAAVLKKENAEKSESIDQFRSALSALQSDRAQLREQVNEVNTEENVRMEKIREVLSDQMNLVSVRKREREARMKLGICEVQLTEAESRVSQLQCYLPRELMQSELPSLEVLLVLQRIAGKCNVLLEPFFYSEKNSLGLHLNPKRFYTNVEVGKFNDDEGLQGLRDGCEMGCVLVKLLYNVQIVENLLLSPGLKGATFIELSLECRQSFLEVEHVIDRMLAAAIEGTSLLTSLSGLITAIADVERFSSSHCDDVVKKDNTMILSLIDAAAMRMLAASAGCRMSLDRLIADEVALSEEVEKIGELEHAKKAISLLDDVNDNIKTEWEKLLRLKLILTEQFELISDNLTQAVYDTDEAIVLLNTSVLAVVNGTEDEAIVEGARAWDLLIDDIGESEEGIKEKCALVASKLDLLNEVVESDSNISEENGEKKPQNTSNAKASPWEVRAEKVRNDILETRSVRSELVEMKKTVNLQTRELRLYEKKSRENLVQVERLENLLKSETERANLASDLEKQLKLAKATSAAEASQSEVAMRALSEEVEQLQRQNRSLQSQMKKVGVAVNDDDDKKSTVETTSTVIDIESQRALFGALRHVHRQSAKWKQLATKALIEKLPPLPTPVRASSNPSEEVRCAMTQVSSIKEELRKKRVDVSVVNLTRNDEEKISCKDAWTRDQAQSAKLVSRYQRVRINVETLLLKEKPEFAVKNIFQGANFAVESTTRKRNKKAMIGRVQFPSKFQTQQISNGTISLEVEQSTLDKIHQLMVK
eukprot:g927.t1